jgi:CheY-like chemotaxis protein
MDQRILMMSLLIVDDDERMRGLIRSIVADLADPITECSDGAEAEACYTEHHPDWVLMDVMMPRMNGFAATSRIMTFDPEAKIVIVTGNESQRLRDAATSAGACAFVSKENLSDLRQLLSGDSCV